MQRIGDAGGSLRGDTRIGPPEKKRPRQPVKEPGLLIPKKRPKVVPASGTMDPPPGGVKLKREDQKHANHFDHMKK